MDCQQLKELLATRDDAGSLPDVVLHAKGCATCLSLLRAEQQMNRGFRVLAALPVKPDISGPVLKKIESGITGKAAPIAVKTGVTVTSNLFSGLAVGFLVLGVVALFSLYVLSSHSKDAPHSSRPGTISNSGVSGGHPPAQPHTGEGSGIASHGLPATATGPSKPLTTTGSPTSTGSFHFQPTSTGNITGPVGTPSQPPANE